MFYVVYEFIVEPEKGNEFKKIWHELTIEIRDKSKGLGSRLHKALNRPNCWIAYAQWPDKETWKNHAPLNISSQAKLTKHMKAICADIKTVYQLEAIDDLIVTDS